jgi:hypothetical protein
MSLLGKQGSLVLGEPVPLLVGSNTGATSGGMKH